MMGNFVNNQFCCQFSLLFACRVKINFVEKMGCTLLVLVDPEIPGLTHPYSFKLNFLFRGIENRTENRLRWAGRVY